MKRGFASDNNSGIHPEIVKAILEANVGHAFGYGDDQFTTKAKETLKKEFGKNSECYFVFNGTAANVLGLSLLAKSYEAIICASCAHIYEDEVGAAEKFVGAKLLPVQTENGKLGIDLIKPLLAAKGNKHQSQPKVISLTQPTEFGAIYSIEELKEIRKFADENDLLVHVDGARLANAAVALGVSLKEAAFGADVLSFGGTKNGLLGADAVIILNKDKIIGDMKYIQKHGMQLASKMRFLSVQFEAYMRDKLYLKNAQNANTMALIMHQKLVKLKVKTLLTPQVNMLFVYLPNKIIAEMKKDYPFYTIRDGEHESVARFVTSFDTTQEDIEQFVQKLEKLM